MLADLQVNFLGVLVAGIATMAVGFLWYSPFLFGKLWVAASGLTEAQIAECKKKKMVSTYAIGFVNGLVMSAVLGVLMNLVLVENVVDSVILTGLVWLGFVLTLMIGGILWEGKKPKLVMINAGYYLVTLLVSGLVQYFFLNL